MTRNLKWLLPAAILVLVAVYFCVGALLSARFDKRLEALRASGALLAWEDLEPPSSSDAENGWPVIAEAQELLEDVEGAWWDRWFADEVVEPPVPRWDRSAPWSEEQRATVAKYVEDARGLLLKLRDVAEFSEFVAPKEKPFSGPSPLLGLAEVLVLEARYEPAKLRTNIEILSRLLAGWGVTNSGDYLGKAVAMEWALTLLRDSVESGARDFDGALEDHLLRVEGHVIADLRREVALERATRLWLFKAWRRGEDPAASVRNQLEEDELARELTVLIELPWYARWYGRPVLNLKGLHLLDEFERDPLPEWTVESLRGWLNSVPAEHGGAGLGRLALQTLAALRMARISLAALAESQPGDDLGKRRDRVRAYFKGALPRDPLTGGSFAWSTDGSMYVLSANPQAVGSAAQAPGRSVDLDEEALIWRFP